MSDLGQNLPKAEVRVESGRPQTANIGRRGRQVSFRATGVFAPLPLDCRRDTVIGFLGGSMKRSRRQFLHLTIGVAAFPVLSGVAVAQGYPARPIRLVVPFPP